MAHIIPKTNSQIDNAISVGVSIYGTTGLVKSNGSGTITPASAGTDYQTPQTTLSGYGITDGQKLSTIGTTEPTTSTVGTLGQLYTDTTTGYLYQCTAISGSTYTWTQVGGGGGGGSMLSYTITIPSSATWTQDSNANWYTTTISSGDATNLLSTDKPMADISLASAEDSDEVDEILEAWQQIFRIVANNGSCTFYSATALTVEMSVSLAVIR